MGYTYATTAYESRATTVTTAAALAISSTAWGWTTAATGGLNVAEIARVTVSSAAVRYSWDGVNPLTTQGHYLAKDTGPLVITGGDNVNALRFIADSSAATGKVSIFVTLEK